MGGYYKADEVRDAARGRWEDILGRCGVNTALLQRRHGPCPGCGGRDRFRFDDKDGEGTWICSQGGGGNISGGGIELVAHVTGKEWKDALRLVGEMVLGESGRHRGRDDRGWEQGVAKAPKRKEGWIPDYDEARLRAAVARVPAGIGKEWFMERSVIDPRRVTPGEFLEHVFEPGERVIIFTEFKGPGDFLWEVGRGGYRLARERGVKAVRSELPTGGQEGVWFLSNPVDGRWHANPRQEGRFSRRSAESVTAWRHFVLESDSAPEDLWLRFLARLPARVVAIYSSGGKSWHALLRVDMASKADFDAYLREKAKRILPIFGADAGAMTPVRLTRLPGCMRGSRLQELIYLNPEAPNQYIEQLPKRREVRP